jgi:hypothetical protein
MATHRWRRRGLLVFLAIVVVLTIYWFIRRALPPPLGRVWALVLRHGEAVGWGLAFLLGLLLLLACILVFPASIVRRDSTPDGSPVTQAELLEAKNGVRTTLLHALAGGLLLIGALLTWLQVQATFRQIALSEDQQRAERFTRAVDQLGNKSLDVRLGGIIGLGQIVAASSKEEDRQAMMQVLTAYVRRHSDWTGADAKQRYTEIQDLRTRAPDVQEAMTILGRENIRVSEALLLAALDLRKLDLSYGNLASASLAGAHLDGADLRNAQIAYADLRHASLVGALLCGAELSEADLEEATLEGAQADTSTVWPVGFDLESAGVRMEGCGN